MHLIAKHPHRSLIPSRYQKTWIYWTVGILLFALILHLTLPTIILEFANHQLNQIPDYRAHIEDIDIHLLRGAYTIQGLKMIKKGGDPDKPFLDAPAIDFSMEWKSLFRGRVVGEVALLNPTLRFINAKEKSESQFSFSKEWKEQGEKLFPFQLNRFVMENGTVIYEDRHAKPEIHLTIREMRLMALNIRNVQDANKKDLPAEISSTGIVFDSGKYDMDAKANLNKEQEDFYVQFKLTNVDLTKLNPFFRHYAKFDFSKGTFSLFSELEANNGRFEGYLKPLLENIAILDPVEKYDQPLEAFWEGLISSVMNLFKNHPKDRFATQIPLSGTLNHPDYGFWATIGNVLRNAFIKAFEPQLDHTLKESKP